MLPCARCGRLVPEEQVTEVNIDPVHELAPRHYLITGMLVGETQKEPPIPKAPTMPHESRRRRNIVHEQPKNQ